MAGALRDNFTGNVVSCNTLIVDGTITAGAVRVTNSSTTIRPPTVVGPMPHVWLPFGTVPETVGTHDLLATVLVAGSWIVEATIVGTGAVASNFAHYTINASVHNIGGVVTVSNVRVDENGTMLSPTVHADLVGGVGGLFTVRVTSSVAANWSGYLKLVGAPTYTV